MPSDLLRPWILKTVVEAASAVTQIQEDDRHTYLGITFQRHDRGPFIPEGSGKMYFSDGEVTMIADFSEANPFISSSIPSSFDPITDRCPPVYAIVRLISFKTEFSALPEPLTINGQQVLFTVTFKVEEFTIQLPQWNMPRSLMPICCFSPGVQQKAANFLTANNDLTTNLAAQITSPSGSSVTSSIVRIVAHSTMTTSRSNSNNDTSVLTQFPAQSQQQMIPDDQAMTFEIGAERLSRRRKIRSSFVDADCQTSIEEENSQQLIQMDSQDSPIVVSVTRPDFLKPTKYVEIPSSAPQLAELPSMLVERAKKTHFLSSSFSKPKSPMLVLSLNRMARSSPKPTPIPRTPKHEESVLDTTRRSLVSSFSAGRKGRVLKSSSRPDLKAKPCVVVLGVKCDAMLTDDVLIRAGLLSNKRKQRKSGLVHRNVEPDGDEEIVELRRKNARKSPDELPKASVAALVEMEPSQLSPSLQDDVDMNRSVIIVEPMITASQLGLIEVISDDDDEEENLAPKPIIIDDDKVEKVTINKVSSLEWWNRLGELSEGMFDIFWTAFGKTNQ